MGDQSQRRRALCKIVVQGRDVTRAFDPHLISVQMVKRSGVDEANEATIELDDRDGRLAIPPNDVNVEIWLGWQNESMGLAWTGVVEDAESDFSRRGGGRHLLIQARGFSGSGLVRSHFRQAWGDGEGEEVKLDAVLQKAAKAAGLSVKVSPSMAQIARKYWAQDESFLHFGSRLARELGGVFNIVGDVAIMTNATDGQNVDGSAMGSVDAVWGKNLIGWRIKPYAAVPQAEKAASVVFNKAKGLWEMFDKEIGGSVPFGLSSAVKSLLPAPAPNKQVADQWNVGAGEGVLSKRGVGSVIINGEPAAEAGGRVNISGARAGVDGSYRVTEVEHVYSRSGGFITRLSLDNPQLDSGDYEAWGWVNKKKPGEPEAEAEAEPAAPAEPEPDYGPASTVIGPGGPGGPDQIPITPF